jgi:Xylose isomerase-like TIM barrel
VILGGHCSGGIKKALDNAHGFGMDAVQLFAQSPRTWRFPDHDPADLEQFKRRREELGIQAVTVHALYLLNLASPRDEFYEKSVTTLRSTMDTACAIEADAVVFHVGSHLGSGFEAGLERVVPALLQCLDHCSETTWLCMENTAGTGDTIGRSLDELVALYEAAGRHERLGICLDSCHLFASGYDITDRTASSARGWASSSATRSCRGSPRCSRSRALTATAPTPSRWRSCGRSMRRLRSDPRDHAERRLADRQLVELRVDAAELFLPALVARFHLDTAERQRGRGRPESAEAAAA